LHFSIFVLSKQVQVWRQSDPWAMPNQISPYNIYTGRKPQWPIAEIASA
jgi:hypothetical protein